MGQNKNFGKMIQMRRTDYKYDIKLMNIIPKVPILFKRQKEN